MHPVPHSQHPVYTASEATSWNVPILIKEADGLDSFLDHNGSVLFAHSQCRGFHAVQSCNSSRKQKPNGCERATVRLYLEVERLIDREVCNTITASTIMSELFSAL